MENLSTTPNTVTEVLEDCIDDYCIRDDCEHENHGSLNS